MAKRTMMLVAFLAAILVAGARGEVVPDRYIVVLKGDDVPNAPAAAEAVARAHGLQVGHVYQHALKGFSAAVPAGRLGALARDPRVAYVEPDLVMQAFAQALPTGINRIDGELNDLAAIDGVDNTDPRLLAMRIAVIDTGIDIDHPDLNVVAGRHFYTVAGGPPWARGSFADDNYDDDNGHGSHVAGTIAATDNNVGVVGLAPGAPLVGVKVLDSGGSGYLSDIIKGVDWVTANAGTIAVANMSLGGQGYSSSFRTALQNSVKAGVFYAVAAGNESRDVYGNDGVFGTSDDIIPAAFPEVAAISAIADSDGQPGGTGGGTSYGSDDGFASFSNFSRSVVSGNPVNSPGGAIDFAMPGVDILSAYKNGGYATGSGTSMASPHGAGLAALTIALSGRDANHDGSVNQGDVYNIRQYLIDLSSVAQTDPRGLAVFNDPDSNPEPIGWAGPLGPPPSVTDLAVTAISAPASVVQGETVSVSVTVSNVGNQDVGSNILVTLTVDGVALPGQTIAGGLAAGASADLVFQWDTTGASIGSHVLEASHNVTDANTGNNSRSTTVNVTSAAGASSVHVGDLDAVKSIKGGSGRWEVLVTVTVHDQDHSPVANATVSGSWSGAASGATSGATGPAGTVTFTTGNMRGGTSVTFAVNDVTLSGATYSATSNHDPDGGSDGTRITVVY